MKTWHVPENISNEQGIELAYSLLEQMESGQFSNDEIQQRIQELLGSKTGARNFLGAYLTSHRNVCEPAVITALQSSPAMISELMVKNLAMPTAMAFTHRRNHNEEMAQESERVSQRSAELIQQLNLDSIQQELQQLLNSITTGSGEYQGFLERWGYDQEQKQAIQAKIAQVSR